MSLFISNVLRFQAYEIHFIDCYIGFSPGSGSQIIDLNFEQDLQFDFSNHDYHKLFKISRFPNEVPKTPGIVGDENGYAVIESAFNTNDMPQPLFDNFINVSRNNADQTQYFNQVSLYEFQMVFIPPSSSEIPLGFWSNKTKKSYYPLYDFPSVINIRERLIYRTQASQIILPIQVRFKLGLYFSYSHDPELLLYI